jgi:hypothetical protein
MRSAPNQNVLLKSLSSDKLITRNTSTLANVSRYWFSEAKFDTMVDIARDEDLIKLLRYFDDIDMYMKRVYHEACNLLTVQ